MGRFNKRRRPTRAELAEGTARFERSLNLASTMLEVHSRRESVVGLSDTKKSAWLLGMASLVDQRGEFADDFFGDVQAQHLFFHGLAAIAMNQAIELGCKEEVATSLFNDLGSLIYESMTDLRTKDLTRIGDVRRFKLADMAQKEKIFDTFTRKDT